MTYIKTIWKGRKNYFKSILYSYKIITIFYIVSCEEKIFLKAFKKILIFVFILHVSYISYKYNLFYI